MNFLEPHSPESTVGMTLVHLVRVLVLSTSLNSDVLPEPVVKKVVNLLLKFVKCGTDKGKLTGRAFYRKFITESYIYINCSCY